MPHLLFMDILLSLHPNVCTLRLTVVTSRVRCLLAINHFQWCAHSAACLQSIIFNGAHTNVRTDIGGSEEVIRGAMRASLPEASVVAQ